MGGFSKAPTGPWVKSSLQLVIINNPINYDNLPAKCWRRQWDIYNIHIFSKPEDKTVIVGLARAIQESFWGLLASIGESEPQ